MHSVTTKIENPALVAIWTPMHAPWLIWHRNSGCLPTCERVGDKAWNASYKTRTLCKSVLCLNCCVYIWESSGTFGLIILCTNMSVCFALHTLDLFWIHGIYINAARIWLILGYLYRFNFWRKTAWISEELAYVLDAPVAGIPLNITLTTQVILPSIQNTVGIHQRIRTS